MLMRGGYCRLKNLTHRNSQTLAALQLVIGGDGRAESPGHSAKFGSYTVMESKKEVGIDISLVQVSTHNNMQNNF